MRTDRQTDGRERMFFHISRLRSLYLIESAASNNTQKQRLSVTRQLGVEQVLKVI